MKGIVRVLGKVGGFDRSIARSESRRRSAKLKSALVSFPLVLLMLTLVTTIGFGVASNGSGHATGSPGGSDASGAASMAAMVVMPTGSSYIPDAPVLIPEGWTATASSQAAGHLADSILTGKPDNYWMSRPSTSLPQSVTIDMGGPQEVSALTYEPRHGAVPQGAIGRFEVTVSTDGKHFGSPIATGTWQNTTGAKTIGFAPITDRWVRLTALSYAAGSGSAVTASSVTLYGAPQEEAPQDVSSGADISTNPGIVGQWGSTIGFPLVPVAAAMLPDNQLLTWSADADESFAPASTANYTQTAILNLNTGIVTQVTVRNTDHNMFCPGVAILPNGEIIVAGGDTDAATSIYNPATDSWSKASPLNLPRGYNGMTLLSNGQAFTLGGSWSGGFGGKSAEVWSPTAGWRELTGIPENSIMPPNHPYEDDSYGWFIATSNGNVLQAGPSPEMHWISTTGAGSITPAGPRGKSGTEMEGNAVYYDTDQILTLGGAAQFSGSTPTNDPATSSAYEINVSSGTAQVTQVGYMHYPRIYSNSVVLPTGQVLVVGGQTSGLGFHDTNSVLNPELWDPTTGKFSVMAPEAEPRNYHSVAVLLPNGQVFSGGGGLCGTGCAANHADGQIYSPPYLFNADGTPATQPNITSAPTSAIDGQTISVTTDSPVSSFSMVRYGESTHASDDDQRNIPLPIVSSSGDTYQLAIPTDPGVALPGPYMLFAINSSGTPSVSSTIMISDVTSSANNSYSQSVLSDGPAIYWPLGDGSGPTATDLSGNGDTGTYSSTGVTYGATSPVEGPGGQGVVLDGSSGEIKASQQFDDPGTYTESMWFQTTTDSGGYLMSFQNMSVGYANTYDHMVWMNDNGQIAVQGSGAGGLSNTTTDAYNDGNWHYVVAVANARGVDVYVDGQLAAETSASSPKPALGRWVVGYAKPSSTKKAPTSDYFAGTVSDVAFSDVTLQASQIQAQYEMGSQGG